MIDPRRTGAIISELRKQRDWTQSKLAEQLNVTHQAVSRWESGVTFPDLAILASIAQLFNVQVDDLLNRKPITSASSIQEVVQSQASREVIDGSLSSDYLEELAPFLRSETLDRIVDLIGQGSLGYELLEELAPYLSKETLRRFVTRYQDGQLEFEHLVELAPFIDRRALNELVHRQLSGEMREE